MLTFAKENKNNKPLDPNSIQTSSTVAFATIGMNEPKIIDLKDLIQKDQK